MTITDKLEEWKYIINEKSKEIAEDKCKVKRLFVRRDNFSDDDTLVFDPLTKGEMARLIRRPWKIPVRKRLNIANDAPSPSYIGDSDVIEFWPVKHYWKRKTLIIIYEER